MTPSLGTVEASRNQANKALDKTRRAAAFKAMLNAPESMGREGGAEREEGITVGGGRVGLRGGGHKRGGASGAKNLRLVRRRL